MPLLLGALLAVVVPAADPVPDPAIPWSWSAPTDATTVTVVSGAAAMPRASLSLAPGDDPGAAGAIVAPPVEADVAGVLRARVGGLAPDTWYTYGWRTADGRLLPAGRVRTPPAPGAPARWRIATGACADWAQAPTFTAMRTQAPDLVLLTGDLHYGNVASEEVGPHRKALIDVLSLRAGQDLLRWVPSLYVWDDHDYVGNDCGAGSPGAAAAHRAFREIVPFGDPVLPGDRAPVARSLVAGRLRIVLTDLRTGNTASDKAPSHDPADPRLMDTAQEAWFIAEVQAAAASDQVVLWVSSVPWTGAPEPGEDRWSGAPRQRQRLADAIKAAGAPVVILAGDAHCVAYAEGVATDFATGGGMPIPVFQAAPLHRETSLKGGPYLRCDDRPDVGRKGMKFGLIDVDDDGVRLMLTLRGRLGADGRGDRPSLDRGDGAPIERVLTYPARH